MAAVAGGWAAAEVRVCLQVLLVRKRACGRLFAMKVLNKADILTRNQLRHTLTERSVLQSVRHPFIVQMHFSFQSQHQLFLVRPQ